MAINELKDYFAQHQNQKKDEKQQKLKNQLRNSFNNRVNIQNKAIFFKFRDQSP